MRGAQQAGARPAFRKPDAQRQRAEGLQPHTGGALSRGAELRVAVGCKCRERGDVHIYYGGGGLSWGTPPRAQEPKTLRCVHRDPWRPVDGRSLGTGSAPSLRMRILLWPRCHIYAASIKDTPRLRLGNLQLPADRNNHRSSERQTRDAEGGWCISASAPCG